MGPQPSTANICTTSQQLLATEGSLKQPTNTKESALQSPAMIQSPHESSSVSTEQIYIFSFMNSLTWLWWQSSMPADLNTLTSDYKSDNLVVGFDSSYEVMPSELSTTANTKQMLLVLCVIVW